MINSSNEKIKNYEEAKEYLSSKIPTQKFTGKFGLERSKKLIDLLGDFKNQKIIHIAGTSGKGSVCYILNSLLIKHGFKVGLHLSPHIMDIRERIQINNKLISENKFYKNLNEIIPYIETIENSEFGSPTYFEILVALALYSFKKEKANYIILETGLGGLYDGTNVFDDKLSIITKIGFDHTKILGNTLTKIAEQKAGIIKKKNIVLSIKQKPVIKKVLESKICKELYFISYKKPNQIYPKLIFDFDFEDFMVRNIELNMLGIHQVENANLAMAALYILSKRDKFDLKINDIKKTLKSINFPGRMEIYKNNQKILIIDAAHNPSKMKSLVESLKKSFPKKKFDFLVAFKQNKDYQKMLNYISTISKKIIITSFTNSQDNFNKSAQITRITNCETISDQKVALKKSIFSNSLVITGSIYFIGEITNKIKKDFFEELNEN